MWVGSVVFYLLDMPAVTALPLSDAIAHSCSSCDANSEQMCTFPWGISFLNFWYVLSVFLSLSSMVLLIRALIASLSFDSINLSSFRSRCNSSGIVGCQEWFIRVHPFRMLQRT